MTERRSPNNQPTVPVLDKHGKPLAPARPSRVRRWLESGRARKVWINHVFAVQLDDVDANDAAISHLSLNVTPGRTTGVAITRESPDGEHRTVVGAYILEHRHREISRNLKQRSEKRSNRRCRLRSRPMRSKNRKNQTGKLRPSQQNLVADHAYIARTMCRLYPISLVRLAYHKFDTQLMQDPNIRGRQYQKGTLEHRQFRKYILTRDNQTCQYCGRPGTKHRKLTLDHIIPESKDGPTRVDNLITACQQCNNRKDDRPIAEFLKRGPQKLAQIQEQVNRMVPLTDAGHLNTVMPSILAAYASANQPVVTTDGVTTQFGREQLGIDKSPTNDAACLDLPQSVANVDGPVKVLNRQSRHMRQSINCNRKGSPNSKLFPAYSRLPRAQQGHTTPPAHSVGPRRLHGIRSGDIVRIRHQSGIRYTGRATLNLKDRRVVLKGQGPNGKNVSAKASDARLIAHARRWTVRIQ